MQHKGRLEHRERAYNSAPQQPNHARRRGHTPAGGDSTQHWHSARKNYILEDGRARPERWTCHNAQPGAASPQKRGDMAGEHAWRANPKLLPLLPGDSRKRTADGTKPSSRGPFQRGRRCLESCQAATVRAQSHRPADNSLIAPTRTKNSAYMHQKPRRTQTKVKPGSVHCPPEIHLTELTVECSRLRHRAVPRIFERARQHFGRAGEVEIWWSVSGQEPCGATSIRSVWTNRDCMDECAGDIRHITAWCGLPSQTRLRHLDICVPGTGLSKMPSLTGVLARHRLVRPGPKTPDVT